MSKPSRSFPRPLSDLLGATLGDALKAQGFASTEIISRWTDIVGTEIATHSEPLKITRPRCGIASGCHRNLRSIRKLPRASRKPCPTSKTRICARHLRGWAPQSSEIERAGRLGRPARHCHNYAIQLANAPRTGIPALGASVADHPPRILPKHGHHCTRHRPARRLLLAANSGRSFG